MVFFMLSSVVAHLGCFHAMPVVNSVAMNTEGAEYHFELQFSPYVCPGLGLQGHMVGLFEVSSGPHTVLIVLVQFPFSPTVWKVLFPHTLCSMHCL